MKVTSVKLRPSTKGSAKAYGSVELDKSMSVQIQIYQGQHGPFVGWPGYKSAKDEKWYSSVLLVDESAKNEINTAILDEFRLLGEGRQEAPPAGNANQDVPF